MKQLGKERWSKVGTTPDTHYTVQRLQPKVPYIFRVMAENKYGKSEPLEVRDATFGRGKIGEYLKSLCLERKYYPGTLKNTGVHSAVYWTDHLEDILVPLQLFKFRQFLTVIFRNCRYNQDPERWYCCYGSL